jgi:hypothetical protein
MTQDVVLSYRLNPYSAVLKMRAARCVPKINVLEHRANSFCYGEGASYIVAKCKRLFRQETTSVMPGKTEGRGDFCTCNHPRAVHESHKGALNGSCLICDCGSFVERTARGSAEVKMPVKSKKKDSTE